MSSNSNKHHHESRRLNGASPFNVPHLGKEASAWCKQWPVYTANALCSAGYMIALKLIGMLSQRQPLQLCDLKKQQIYRGESAVANHDMLHAACMVGGQLILFFFPLPILCVVLSFVLRVQLMLMNHGFITYSRACHQNFILIHICPTIKEPTLKENQ